jgi:hypothetical protein
MTPTLHILLPKEHFTVEANVIRGQTCKTNDAIPLSSGIRTSPRSCFVNLEHTL